MPLTQLSFGTQFDRPLISPEAFVWGGVNIRVRAGVVESLGLFGPLRDFDAGTPITFGSQIQLQSGDIFRKIFTSPSIIQGQIVAASTSTISLIQFDPSSTIASGTRWEVFDLTPSGGLSVEPDTISNPSSGRVEIPPVWWFADQDDLIIGSRANVATDVPYVWDRSSSTDFEPLQITAGGTTPIPTGAVGGGILNRILILLGCTSYTDPDPQRYMTIRWSDRFDYGEWTPTDITVSGEIQLEGGSRIIGGGVTGYGVIAWTDKRMALLTETFDVDSVFDRRYVDGGRGMLSNNAWCEADAQVFWMDETRTLNVFDGGRPRQIVNTNRYASIERLQDDQIARLYIQPNQEFGEIIIHYPSGSDTEVDAQIVYNYIENCWYPWQLERSAWNPRFGMIPNTAIDAEGYVYQHDLDVGLPDEDTDPFISSPSARVSVDDVFPMSFSFTSNLVTLADPSYTSWTNSKVTMDYLIAPAEGAADTFDVTMTGYQEPNVTTATYSDMQTFAAGDTMKDYRVGGKALRFGISATDVKTVYRFGMVEISGAVDGER